MAVALARGEWSTPRPGRFTPGKDPVPIVQEAGWAPWPVWMGAENLASTGIRSPDRPSRSESLYRLSYPGPFQTWRDFKFILRVIAFATVRCSEAGAIECNYVYISP